MKPFAPRSTRPLFFCSVLALAPGAVAQDAAAPDASAPAPQATLEAPPAPRRKRRIPPVGVDFETVYLLDSKARGVFGSTVSGFGPGLGRPSLNPKGRIGLDFSLLRNGDPSRLFPGQRNKFTLAFVGAEYRRAYLSPRFVRAQAARDAAEAAARAANGTPEDTAPREALRPTLLPYYGASVGAVYASVEAPDAGVDGSSLGASGSVFLGLAFKQRAFLEARLRGATRTQSFNFSGAGLSLGVRF